MKSFGTLVLLIIMAILGQIAYSRTQFQPTVMSIDWHPSGEYLAVALDADTYPTTRDDESVWIYNAAGQPLVTLAIPQTEAILDVEWNQDGSRLAVSTVEGAIHKIRIWWTDNPQQPVAQFFTSDHLYVDNIAWNNLLLATNYGGDHIQIWDTSTNQLVQTIEAMLAPDRVAHLAWNTSTNVLAASGQDVVQFWDVSTTPKLDNTIQIEGGIESIAWNEDDTKLIISANQEVHIWQQSTGITTFNYEEVAVLEGHTSIVGHAEWVYDRIASVGSDGTLRIWNPATGQQIGLSSTGTYGSARAAMALSPDGSKVVYAAPDGSLAIESFPAANAGPDQTQTDTDGNGSELVTLDGNGSTDSDGTIVSYGWQENGVTIATGPNPQVELAVGVHTITLTVTDNDGLGATDEVVITVEAGSTISCDISVPSADTTSLIAAITTANGASGRGRFGTCAKTGHPLRDDDYIAFQNALSPGSRR